MLATGVVRRLDDLGRVVIPKEIRRRIHIREGDPLEIYLDTVEGGVVFKPRQKEKEPWEALKDIIEDIDLRDEYLPFIPRLQQLAWDMKKAASN